MIWFNTPQRRLFKFRILLLIIVIIVLLIMHSFHYWVGEKTTACHTRPKFQNKMKSIFFWNIFQQKTWVRINYLCLNNFTKSWIILKDTCGICFSRARLSTARRPPDPFWGQRPLFTFTFQHFLSLHCVSVSLSMDFVYLDLKQFCIQKM